MLPAVSFQDILDRRDPFSTYGTRALESRGIGRKRASGTRLVSVVFAPPDSPIWEELRNNRAFLDYRSGQKWDLFFPGMSAFAPMDDESSPVPILDPTWNHEFGRHFNPKYFYAVLDEIARQQHASARSNGLKPWLYSGGTELISFLVINRQPDWGTFHALRIDESKGHSYTLSEVTELLTDWREIGLDEDLRQQVGAIEGQQFERSRTALLAALKWSATAAGAGTLGNAAFQLLRELTKL